MEPTWTEIYIPLAVVLAVAATSAVLIYGILQMAKRNPTDPEAAIARARRSNKLMQYRIILQLIAVGVFLLMIALRG